MNRFEVEGFTTDYPTWTVGISDEIRTAMDEKCWGFAKKQAAFMTSPVALVGDVVYTALSVIADDLDEVKFVDGPLYEVRTVMIEDKTQGKISFRTYIDPETLAERTGDWYPLIKAYRIRYGKPQ